MSLVLIIAVLNVGLGFAVAVLLGQRWRAVAAEEGLAAGLWPAIAGRRGEAPSDVPVNTPQPAAKIAPLPMTDDAPPRPPFSPQARAIDECRTHVDAFHERLDAADEQLRAQDSAFDAAAIEACLASLRTATEEYLIHRQQGATQIGDMAAALGADSDAATELQAAVSRQDEQIGHAHERFTQFTSDGDLAQERAELAIETSRLLDANHGVRDALVSAATAFDRVERRLDPNAPCPPDALTGLTTRAGLEVGLAEHWLRDPHRVRALCVAMFDIDGMAGINQAHGHRAGDDILRALAGVFRNELRQEMTVGRFAGEKFCLVMPDIDVRFATNLVERIRQTLELTQFVRGASPIRLTTSSGITESTAEDTARSLFDRADAALREAKRYGRNRTFLHEGKYPTPVIPPNFSLEEKQISI